MLEVRYEKFGPPSVVAKCVKAAELGSPSAWDAIVEVHACPVNPSDLAMLSGHYGTLNKPPATIGMEAAGRVVAVGDSVTDLKIDDQVMVMANNNWAQFRKVPASLLHKVPADLDPLQVAMMKVNPATALLMLTKYAELRKNDWVIQNGPLSNVGRAVIQIAKHKGLRTINVVRRPDAIQEVIDLGGDVALEESANLADDVRASIGRAKLKLGLDAVAGSSTGPLASCLSPQAPIVNYGMLSGKPCEIDSNDVIFRGIQLVGFWLSKIVNRMSQQQRTELYDEITEMIVAGVVCGKVDSFFRLEEIGEAIRHAETPGRRGKVMVLPHGELDGMSLNAANRNSLSV